MKIVRESLLNEDFSSTLKKTKSFLKNVLKKVGKYFVAFSGDEAIPAVSPVNIGIAYKAGLLPKYVTYVPSVEDIKNDPSLQSLKTDRNVLAKRSIKESFKAMFINEAKINLQHPDKNVPNVNTPTLMKRIRMALMDRKSKPLMVWGAPGIGKTAIVKEILESSKSGRLIDVPTSKMAPDDWFLPAVDKETMHAYDIPKSWLPVYKEEPGNHEENSKRDDVANGNGGGIIFLDELSRASGSVQNTCLKLIDERKIGEYIIGSKWAIISASNRAEDDPDSVQNFSKALANRFSQINFVPDFKSWKNWALKALVDPKIMDFLEFNEEYFYTMETNPEQTIFATPRSWEAASKNLKLALEDAEANKEHLSDSEMSDIVASDVGKDAAVAYVTFLRLLSRYNTEDIKEVFTTPDKAKMPPKKGSGYELSEANALVLVICTSTRNKELSPVEFENFCKYLVRLDNASLATKGIKVMVDIHPNIHMETGEVKGKDKYKKALDLFVAKYGNVLSGDD